MADKILAAKTFSTSSKHKIEMSSQVPLSPTSALHSTLPKQPTPDSNTRKTNVSQILLTSLQQHLCNLWKQHHHKNDHVESQRLRCC